MEKPEELSDAEYLEKAKSFKKRLREFAKGSGIENREEDLDVDPGHMAKINDALGGRRYTKLTVEYGKKGEDQNILMAGYYFDKPGVSEGVRESELIKVYFGDLTIGKVVSAKKRMQNQDTGL